MLKIFVCFTLVLLLSIIMIELMGLIKKDPHKQYNKDKKKYLKKLIKMTESGDIVWKKSEEINGGSFPLYDYITEFEDKTFKVTQGLLLLDSDLLYGKIDNEWTVIVNCEKLTKAIVEKAKNKDEIDRQEKISKFLKEKKQHCGMLL